MRPLSAIVGVSLLVAPVASQVNFNVTTCSNGAFSNNVPDPLFPTTLGMAGTFQLAVEFCPAVPSLFAWATGSPTNYLDPAVTYDHVIFAIVAGGAQLPGYTLFGGDVYLGTGAVVSYDIGSVVNVTGPTGCAGATGCGTVGNYGMGGSYDFSSLIPVAPAGLAFTVQAFLWDPNLPRLYQTQAITFTL